MKWNKVRISLILFTATSFYIVISAYSGGPASSGGYDCTGAETGLGNPTGCTVPGGCHSASATAGIAVTIELDSVGVPTTHYMGGGTYTVKITGTNNTASNLPRYGFQMGCIKGSVPQVTPTNEGTWKSPFPSSTHYAPPLANNYTVGVVEQSALLAPLSGSGGNGTVYSKTFNWVAPNVGTGTISFWAALNAVNSNSNADGGDLWNTTHLVVDEWSFDAVASIEQNFMDMNVFPNPASDYATLEYTLKENTNLQVELYDISGKKICNLFSEEQTAGLHQQIINLSNLSLKNGLYLVVLNDGVNPTCRKLIVQ